MLGTIFNLHNHTAAKVSWSLGSALKRRRNWAAPQRQGSDLQGRPSIYTPFVEWWAVLGVGRNVTAMRFVKGLAGTAMSSVSFLVVILDLERGNVLSEE
jgi:hypothetical protein